MDEDIERQIIQAERFHDPVSYTHLDVYKSQRWGSNTRSKTLDLPVVLPDKITMNKPSGLARPVGPVSYTHLDVYKRQGGDKRTRP